MNNTKKNLSKNVHIIIALLVFSGIFISCDSSYIDASEEFESIHSEKKIEINRQFRENNIDITIKDIKPAGQDVIASIKKSAYEQLQKKQDQGAYLISGIKWNKTEVLSIKNYNMHVAITEIGDSSDNSRRFIYSLINNHGVINQFINTMPNANGEIANEFLSNEQFDLWFEYTKLEGSCVIKDEISYTKLEVFDSPTAAYSSDGCWSSCVKETVSEGSAGFLLFCMATGPYCAAAIAIACGGKCAIQ